MTATGAQMVCRAALRRGDLIMRRRSNGVPDWRFGKRAFSERTIAVLIATGEAVRHGDVVSYARTDLRVVERAGFLRVATGAER
jgi:hypothetical protein